MGVDFLMGIEAMQTAANTLNECAADSDDIVRGLDANVTSMEGSWAGKTYEAFLAAYTELKPELEEFAVRCQTMAQTLRDAATKTQNADRYK